eukprot:TRINITY_DN5073_c0_g1_i7.p1 TRINITY_DN5073_c0_g1~~TRINITY_DN5073_c0_g1_i7.p1  ORF type:complete len:659 (-),score=101.61 TRINITY_DN5073_c0_g1_i7:224-2200(-)
MTDWECINRIRVLSADVVQKANSGHPGAPLGMAPMAYVLFSRHLRFNPKNPDWPGRDRFVLSNGHSSALLYSLLHLTGYPDWTMDVLKTFRQSKSMAAGHPESHYPGVEVTTGPLGQGLSNAVGLAIAETHLAAKFNKDGIKVVDNFTYVFCGDGCLQEGITSEASSLAGHLGLGKLIVLYDDNHITIDGSTDLSFSEDVCKRYESYGWHTQVVKDGDKDLEAIDAAITAAKAVSDKPSLIKVNTTIGFGSLMAGTGEVHGSPLGVKGVAHLKTFFGYDPNEFFHIPDEVYKVMDGTKKGKELEDEWNSSFAVFTDKYPNEATELKRRFSGTLPEGWDQNLPTFSEKDPAISTRKASGQILNHFASKIPDLFGGSADLNPSCFTYLNSDKDYLVGSYDQRNVRFGVREHAMAAICNGLHAYGGFIPFCSTFLNFIGYAYGAVILSSLSEVGVLYIFTHDSVLLAEDGPTHQPIEKYAVVRSTPGINLFRPADSKETLAAYLSAIRSRKTPTVFALTRQNVPNLAGTSVEGALRGGYVVNDPQGASPDIVLVATGSELSLCVGAASRSSAKVRVVSLCCWELFEQQPLSYRESVFPSGVPVLSVEAGSAFGWERYAHASIAIDTHGMSANLAVSLFPRHEFPTLNSLYQHHNSSLLGCY